MARALAAAVALGALVSLPTPAAAGVGDALRHEALTLENGLRVFILPDRRAPTVAVVTWFQVGSAHEERGRNGLAHLFEHLMFKGSPHVADGAMDEMVEEAGGWTNAYTDEDMTVYTTVASSAALERLLWLEADRIAGLDRALDQAKLDNQRDVVLNERRQNYENRPYGMAGILIPAALWPEGHPYHAPTIGTPEDLRAVTVADARAFFATHYTPENAVVVIAGDLDVDMARALARRYLGSIPARPRHASPAGPTSPPAALGRLVALEATDDVQVPRVYVSWRGPRVYTADEASLELATVILAGGKSSRLYQRLVVVERLAQDVFAGNGSGVRGGTMQIVATVKPDVAPAKVLAAIDAEIRAIASAPPNDDELARARNTREARFLQGLEDLVTRAETLAEYAVLAGDAGFLERDLARHRAVTAREIQAAIRRYLCTAGRVVLTISPRERHAP
jgi:zinc protease